MAAAPEVVSSGLRVRKPYGKHSFGDAAVITKLERLSSHAGRNGGAQGSCGMHVSTWAEAFPELLL